MIVVEQKVSAVLSVGNPGRHLLQGIGAGFVPAVFDKSVVDEIIPVDDADAFQTMRRLMLVEGIICGPSSGAAVWAALTVAAMPDNREKVTVAVAPDTGECCLSILLCHAPGSDPAGLAAAP